MYVDVRNMNVVGAIIAHSDIVTVDQEPRCHPRLAPDIRRPRSSCKQGVLFAHLSFDAHPSVLAWRRCQDDGLQNTSLSTRLLKLSSRWHVGDKFLETSDCPEHPRSHVTEQSRMTTWRRLSTLHLFSQSYTGCRSNREHLFLAKLHWLPVKSRVSFKLATPVYNIRQSGSPSYLASLFTDYKQVRDLRSSSMLLLEFNRPRLKPRKGHSVTLSSRDETIFRRQKDSTEPSEL